MATTTPSAQPHSTYTPPAHGTPPVPPVPPVTAAPVQALPVTAAPVPRDPTAGGQARALGAMLRRLHGEQELARLRSGGGMARMTPEEREAYERRESRIGALRRQLLALDGRGEPGAV